jgi:hypothetical protein
MADGDLVVADNQFELRTTLMGATTVYKVTGFDGLGEPPVRQRDVELFGQDGDYAAPDYRGPRIILMTIEIVHTSATNVFAAMNTLRTAWAPSTTDITLYWRWPSLGKQHVSGRPRGLEVQLDPSRVRNNITCIGEFHALDPTITTP